MDLILLSSYYLFFI